MIIPIIDFLQELDIVYKVPHAVPISAHHKWNFDDLLETIWEYLKLVRIYTKPKGEETNWDTPHDIGRLGGARAMCLDVYT